LVTDCVLSFTSGQIDNVVADLNTVFSIPAWQMGAGGVMLLGQDAERTNNGILTNRGRQQVLSGKRECDPAKVLEYDQRHHGRSLPNSYEIPWMVEPLEKWNDNLRKWASQALGRERAADETPPSTINLRIFASLYVWAYFLFVAIEILSTLLLARVVPLFIRITSLVCYLLKIGFSENAICWFWWSIAGVFFLGLAMIHAKVWLSI